MVVDSVGEVVFEIQRINRFVKVSAVHVATGVEVSVICPITTPELTLQQVVLSKLAYAMRKHRHATIKRWA